VSRGEILAFIASEHAEYEPVDRVLVEREHVPQPAQPLGQRLGARRPPAPVPRAADGGTGGLRAAVPLRANVGSAVGVFGDLRRQPRQHARDQEHRDGDECAGAVQRRAAGHGVRRVAVACVPAPCVRRLLIRGPSVPARPATEREPWSRR